jgi:hypothetical protein
MRVKVIVCKSRETAKKRAPWAAKLVKMIGGFVAFESMTDYDNWKRQR